jgi:hypothetical protein
MVTPSGLAVWQLLKSPLASDNEQLFSGNSPKRKPYYFTPI